VRLVAIFSIFSFQFPDRLQSGFFTENCLLGFRLPRFQSFGLLPKNIPKNRFREASIKRFPANFINELLNYNASQQIRKEILKKYDVYYILREVGQNAPDTNCPIM